MKRAFFAFLFAAAFSGPASAGTYSNFPLATPADLKPFTRDIGGLLGSGTLQTARVLGFGGFDLGVRSVTQLEPEDKDGILEKNHPFSLGWVQAQIGGPLCIDGFIRAGSYDGIAMAGGGLKYGFSKPVDEPYRGQIMLVGMGNMATHRYFYITQFSASLLYSINVPVVSPFFSYGFDNTRLTVQSGMADTTLVDKSFYAMEQRYTFGLRAKFKVGYASYYLSCGVTRTHGRNLVVAGTGLRF